jgi:peroxiredoxin
MSAKVSKFTTLKNTLGKEYFLNLAKMSLNNLLAAATIYINGKNVVMTKQFTKDNVVLFFF